MVSLNDQLLAGSTVHAPLLDVLLRFRQHKIALTTDVRKMYRAFLLPKAQRDLYHLVWRRSLQEPLQDYRMTRLTFRVSASSFVASMAVKQNTILHQDAYPPRSWSFRNPSTWMMSSQGQTASLRQEGSKSNYGNCFREVDFSSANGSRTFLPFCIIYPRGSSTSNPAKIFPWRKSSPGC